MKYWNELKKEDLNPEILGQKKLYDNTIYTFDIETSSYIILDEKIIPAIKYLELNKDEQERAIFQSVMYIWQFGINDSVYYGRTWEELEKFISFIDETIGKKIQKYIFVHNLSYEFQFLRNQFEFDSVFSRKSRKVIKCNLKKYNFELRCSYYMSNSSLDRLAKNYMLDAKKLIRKS